MCIPSHAQKLENETFFGRKENGLQPSPIDKNKIVLVGYPPDKEKRTKESSLWISVDAGVNWTPHSTPGFRLDGNILFHAFEPNLLLAYSNSANFSVHLSTDFGRTWKMIKELVRAVHWGFYGETIFVAVDPGVGVYGTPPNGFVLAIYDIFDRNCVRWRACSFVRHLLVRDRIRIDFPLSSGN